MEVDITKKEYILCDEKSKNYWANTKKGHYGKGLINTNKDPCKVTRIGLLGEFAFHKISGLDYDFEYREKGDKYDFILPNRKTIDVKTAARNYKMNMVIYQNAQGKNVFQPNDYFVLSYLKNENQISKLATIKFMGFLSLETVQKECRIKKSPRGNHKNYELEFRKAEPIEILLDKINA